MPSNSLFIIADSLFKTEPEPFKEKSLTVPVIENSTDSVQTATCDSVQTVACDSVQTAACDSVQTTACDSVQTAECKSEGNSMQVDYMSNDSCRNCGRMHAKPEDCKARFVVCCTCRMIGHFAKFCPTGSHTQKKGEVPIVDQIKMPYDVIRFIIDFYSKHVHLFSIKRARKRPHWEKMAHQLNKKGFSYSWKQCKDKWYNITAQYRKIQNLNNSIGEDIHTCAFYNELSAVYESKFTQHADTISSLKQPCKETELAQLSNSLDDPINLSDSIEIAKPQSRVHVISDEVPDVEQVKMPNAAVLIIIDYYSKHEHSLTLKGSRKKPHWERMSHILKEKGFPYSWKQCKNKWYNITSQYRKTQNLNDLNFYKELSTVYSLKRPCSETDLPQLSNSQDDTIKVSDAIENAKPQRRVRAKIRRLTRESEEVHELKRRKIEMKQEQHKEYMKELTKQHDEMMVIERQKIEIEKQRLTLLKSLLDKL